MSSFTLEIFPSGRETADCCTASRSTADCRPALLTLVESPAVYSPFAKGGFLLQPPF